MLQPPRRLRPQRQHPGPRIINRNLHILIRILPRQEVLERRLHRDEEPAGLARRVVFLRSKSKSASHASNDWMDRQTD